MASTAPIPRVVLTRTSSAARYGGTRRGLLPTARAQSSPLGTIILGDSATAHFRIPPFIFRAPEFFDPTNWNGGASGRRPNAAHRLLHLTRRAAAADMLYLALNELDWPECSWVRARWPAFADSSRRARAT
jgi:hypothetical protein